MLFVLWWSSIVLPPFDPVSTTLLNHPLRSRPIFNGLANGEPFTLSILSSLRGHRGYDDDEAAGMWGLKIAVDGGLPLAGREGFDGVVAEGILDGEAGLSTRRGKGAGFAIGL